MGGCICEYGCSMIVCGCVCLRMCTGNMSQKIRELTCVMIVLVQVDSFRSQLWLHYLLI